MRLPKFGSKKQRSRAPRASSNSGQLSNRGVFSYYNSPSSAQSTELLRKSPTKTRQPGKIRWHHIPSLIAAGAIIVCFLYILGLSTNPKIVALKSQNESSLLRENKAYQEAAKTILSGSFLNKSKITIDTAGFNRDMKQKFPELAEASITLPLIGRRPIVELKATKPELIISSQPGVSYLVDGSGRVIINAKDAVGADKLKLPVVTDQGNLKLEQGKGAITSEDVDFITTIVKQMQAKKIAITSMNLPTFAGELQVRIEGKPYFIKFNLLEDPLPQVGAFLAVKEKLERDKITPTEYIDARVEERVFYK